jgi:hypothetical protein
VSALLLLFSIVHGDFDLVFSRFDFVPLGSVVAIDPTERVTVIGQVKLNGQAV